MTHVGCRSIRWQPTDFRHPCCCSPRRPRSALGMSLRPGGPRGRVRAYVRELIRCCRSDAAMRGSSVLQPAGQPQHAFALWAARMPARRAPNSRDKAEQSQLDLPFEPSSFPRYLASNARSERAVRTWGEATAATDRGATAPGLAKREWHVLVLDHVLDLPLHGEEEERDEVHEEDRPEYGYVEAARMQ